jgi:hypothetical protein
MALWAVTGWVTQLDLFGPSAGFHHVVERVTSRDTSGSVIRAAKSHGSRVRPVLGVAREGLCEEAAALSVG